MKKAKRFLAQSLIPIAVFMSVFAGTAFAEDVVTADKTAVIAANDPAEQLRAEETGFKYKYENGVWYRRLWSYTYGRWIDPAWTPVP